MPDPEKYQGKMPCLYCVWNWQRQEIQFLSTLLFSFTVIFYWFFFLLFSSRISFQNVSFLFLLALSEQKQPENCIECIGFRTAIVREGCAPKLVLCSVEASVWPYRWSRFESWQGQPGAKRCSVSVQYLVFQVLSLSPRRCLLFLVYSLWMVKFANSLGRKKINCKVSISNGQDGIFLENKRCMGDYVDSFQCWIAQHFSAKYKISWIWTSLKNVQEHTQWDLCTVLCRHLQLGWLDTAWLT